MGLATTGVSCAKYNRKFVGVEIHEPYYKIADERMQQENAQIKMWEMISWEEGDAI